uniref:Uncharacterized protein n=1 Tax=Anguilla anguilla TaxID=7936 RepID=A0A0E9V6P0_ANGAN
MPPKFVTKWLEDNKSESIGVAVTHHTHASKRSQKTALPPKRGSSHRCFPC